jgi:hypothetical protein
MSETKFYTHTERQAKLSSCIFLFLSFLIGDEKTEGSEPNDSKHYQNSTFSLFPPEPNFGLLLPFPNILTVTHFQMICLLFLCPDFGLHSGDEITAYSLSKSQSI